MAGEERASEKYREFWLDTADCVFNLLLGRRGGDGTLGRICRWCSEEDTVAFPEDLWEYGLRSGPALATAEEALRSAERITAPSRVLREGFALDELHRPYTPAKKAEEIYDDIRRRMYDRAREFYGVDMDELADLCAMTYEREEARASLAFFSKENDLSGVGMKMELDEKSRFPFDRPRLREIRKLLAGVRQGESLLFAGDESGRYVCRGYASLGGVKPPLSVTLQGRRGGLFYTGDTVWFRLAGNRILAPEEPYRLALRRLCRELNLSETDYEGLFRALARQSKGAAAVFADLSDPVIAAWYECLAGYGRAWKLKGISVVNLKGDEEERIRALCRIDGALVVDTSTGALAYTGAVLDALAITDGLRDRGARANGILSHIANLAVLGGVKRPIGAVVCSEDGMIMPIFGSTYSGGAKELKERSRHPAVQSLTKH